MTAEMSLADKVINYTFIILFIFVFGLNAAADAYLRLTCPEYANSEHYYEW